MGSAGNTVRRASFDSAGENAWEKSRLAIADFWDAIETAMDSLRLDYRKARLYQEGLPNYRILLKLMERGATLEGTEDPDLLRTEYELIMSTAAGTTDAGWSEGVRAARLRDLLDQRDRFIAWRIDATLALGDIGILFLGALHRAVQKLPSSIQVISLSQMLRSQATLENTGASEDADALTPFQAQRF